MTACPDANALGRLADGAVDADERFALELHCASCDDCARVIAELGGLVLARRAPPGFRAIASLAPGAWLAETADGRRVELRMARARGARRAQLVRDALAVKALGDREVEPIVAAGELSDDEVFVAAALRPLGSSLAAWAASGGDAVAMWRRAVMALDRLHRAGIVHGALDPQRIEIRDGGIVVIGFGGAPEPAYVAPELAPDDARTASSDQFALCAVLWELLSGQRPYLAPTRGAMIVAAQSEPVLPRGDRRVFEALRRGLRAEPARRWPSLAELERALAGRGARRWPWGA